MNIIDERLDSYLGQGEEDYFLQKDNEYHISSIGRCPRFIFLERTQRRPDENKNKRVFVIGKIIHDFVQDKLFGDYIKEEQLSYSVDGINLVGRIDLNNKNEIIELKSCKSLAYILNPYDEHIVQVNTYMGIKGINKAQIIYIDKQDMGMVTFNIEFDKKLFDESINNIIKLNKKIQAKTSYKGIGQKIGHNCKYCKYKDLCGFNEKN